MHRSTSLNATLNASSSNPLTSSKTDFFNIKHAAVTADTFLAKKRFPIYPTQLRSKFLK